MMSINFLNGLLFAKSFLCKNAHHFICDDHDFFLSQKFFILIIIVIKNAFGAENYLIYA